MYQTQTVPAKDEKIKELEKEKARMDGSIEILKVQIDEAFNQVLHTGSFDGCANGVRV